MKAAERWNKRPSVLVLGKDSRKPWSRVDIVLAKAYERYKEELCPQCGLPKYICHTSDERIQFKTTTDECRSTARAEAEQARLAAQKDYKGFGRRIFGEPYLVQEAIDAGVEMSDLRRPYFEEEAERRAMSSQV